MKRIQAHKENQWKFFHGTNLHWNMKNNENFICTSLSRTLIIELPWSTLVFSFSILSLQKLLQIFLHVLLSFDVLLIQNME